MHALAVDISVLTERELKQFLELRRRQREWREGVIHRVEVQIESLHASKHRYEHAHAVNSAAACCYHEAVLFLAEDPDDDFAAAREKAEKLARIEEEYIAAGAAFQNASRRCEWEIGQVT